MSERQTTTTRLVFSAKVYALRAQRALMEWQNRPQRWPQTECDWSGRRFEVRSALFVDDREAERAYELGKVQNLRAALPYLHGVEIPAGEIFSFWRQVGRATHGRGFVRGRMVQAGCVVPAIGGGLCQLSNALYELALRTGCEIVERHAHSHRLAGMPQHDATVAWNYVDLRFRATRKIRLDLTLSDSELIASFVCGESALPTTPPTLAIVDFDGHEDSRTLLSETCTTCSEAGCSRHERRDVSTGR